MRPTFNHVLAFLSLTLLSGAAFADTSDRCPGEDGYYYTNYRTTNNPRAGGFVAWTATVSDSTAIVIQPSAAVCGNAIITGSAKISGNSIVRGDAQVSGNSVITGSVVLEGSVKVKGDSVIKGTGTLSSGLYSDVDKVLEQPVSQSASSSGASPEAVAEKLQAYVRTYAKNFAPADGSHYDGRIYLSQSISFANGPCVMTVEKHRGGSDSSFGGRSKTRFNVGQAYNVLSRFYSPALSTVSIQIKDYESKATREYSDDKGVTKGEWINHYNLYNSNSVESIELPSAAHAENVRKMLLDLVAACKSR